MCCWPEAQVCGSVKAYLRRSTSQQPSECSRVRIWEDFGREQSMAGHHPHLATILL